MAFTPTPLTSVTEDERWHDAVKHEYIEIGLVRDEITIVSGTAASDQLTLLGTVTASGKFTDHDPAASDGSETASGILYSMDIDASAGDLTAVALVRGPAIIDFAKLNLITALNASQILAAKADLLAVGIKHVDGA